MWIPTISKRVLETDCWQNALASRPHLNRGTADTAEGPLAGIKLCPRYTLHPMPTVFPEQVLQALVDERL